MRGVSNVSAGVARVALMPSFLHVVLVEMFRDRPRLAADLMSGPLGVSVPAFEHAHVAPADLNAVIPTPTKHRADAVIILLAGNRPVLGVVVEVQLRFDTRQRRCWPTYVGNLHARLECPVQLLVVCLDPAVAAWCRTPIEVGPDPVVRPLGVGPAGGPGGAGPLLARRQPGPAGL